MAGALAAPGPPLPLRYNVGLLNTTWGLLAAKDARVLPAFESMVHSATAQLGAGPWSVMQCNHTPPSGDRHDYMSIAKYWWDCRQSAGVCNKTAPNCNASTGMPWVSCDGHTNTAAVNEGDEPKVAALAAAVDALAKGWYWTRNESYATRAVELVRYWFLDPATAMNPNLNFGQAFPGVVPNGTSSGLIETDITFIKIFDGLALLPLSAPCQGLEAKLCPGSTAWTAADQEGLVAWLNAWSRWLVSSPFSAQALNFYNNHNTWCRASWLVISAWTQDWSTSVSLLNGAKEGKTAPIGGQIWRNGELPAECQRVDSIGYVTMDLQALVYLGLSSVYAPFISAVGPTRVGNLFAYVSTANQSSIRGAMDFIVPYANGSAVWPFPAESPTTTFAGAYGLFRQAAHALRDARYLAVAQALPGSHAADEGNLWWPDTL